MNPIAEIDECRSLFLTDIQETGGNSLRLVVEEGQPDGTRDGRVFEIVWDFYVGYSVLNETFVQANDEEVCEGRRFRIYSKSHFLAYMACASFASEEHPGPTRHYRVACEDHIVDVLSTAAPSVRKLR